MDVMNEHQRFYKKMKHKTDKNFQSQLAQEGASIEIIAMMTRMYIMLRPFFATLKSL